jgi:TPR repeat protein
MMAVLTPRKMMLTVNVHRRHPVSKTFGLLHLKRAADAGHADARYQYGQCLISGNGCNADPIIGLDCLQRSATGGNGFAQAKIGEYLENGRIIEKDVPAAAELYRLSSDDQGNALGQWNYGRCLENGIGTAQNLPRAAE